MNYQNCSNYLCCAAFSTLFAGSVCVMVNDVYYLHSRDDHKTNWENKMNIAIPIILAVGACFLICCSVTVRKSHLATLDRLDLMNRLISDKSRRGLDAACFDAWMFPVKCLTKIFCCTSQQSGGDRDEYNQVV